MSETETSAQIEHLDFAMRCHMPHCYEDPKAAVYLIRWEHHLFVPIFGPDPRPCCQDCMDMLTVLQKPDAAGVVLDASTGEVLFRIVEVLR